MLCRLVNSLPSLAISGHAYLIISASSRDVRINVTIGCTHAFVLVRVPLHWTDLTKRSVKNARSGHCDNCFVLVSFA